MHSFLKKTSKIILLSLIFSIVFRIFFVYPLSDAYLPGGTDTPAHLFRTWYIAKYGLLKWNYYWAGGQPFIRYYPPLEYWISGYIGRFIGWLLAHKLIINIFFVLIPLAFYLFLKEFKLSKENVALSLIMFTLFPVFFYFFYDGRHPTLVSYFFSILYWKFLKKSVDKNKSVFLLLSSIFLLLSFLAHYLTAGYVIAISFIWLLFHYKNTTSFFKFSKIVILMLLLSMWYWAPLLIETLIQRQTMEVEYFVGATPIIEAGKRFVFAPFTYLNLFLKYKESAYIIYILMGLLGTLSLISFFKMDKITKDFFIILVSIAILLAIFSYKRLFIFASIPLSVLTSKGIYLFKKTRYVFVFFIVIFGILSWFVLEKQIYIMPSDIPILPNDGRVIYLPSLDTPKQPDEESKSKYSLFLAPIQGNENILEWGLNFETGLKRMNYIQEIVRPFEHNQSEYYILLKEGWVNYVVVDKRYSEIVEYFDKNNNFRLYNKTDSFFIFEIYPKSSYIEINNDPIYDFELKKQNDKIFLNFTCENGSLKIKEGYHQNWNSILNDKKIKLNSNEYGFIETKINDTGSCSILMSFSDPDYYIIFKLVPLITLCFSILFISGKELRKILTIK